MDKKKRKQARRLEARERRAEAPPRLKALKIRISLTSSPALSPSRLSSQILWNRTWVKKTERSPSSGLPLSMGATLNEHGLTCSSIWPGNPLK